MPTTDLDQRVKRIAALSDAEVTLLTNEGIMTEDDLKVLQFADLPAAIPVVKRRKLNIIGQYLSCRYIMNGFIDLLSIQTRITPAPVGNANAGGAQEVDMNRGAPKIHTNPLPEFSTKSGRENLELSSSNLSISISCPKQRLREMPSRKRGVWSYTT